MTAEPSSAATAMNSSLDSRPSQVLVVRLIEEVRGAIAERLAEHGEHRAKVGEVSRTENP